MEKHQNGQQGPSQTEQRESRSGAPSGFEGMNFEEQRSSYNTSEIGGQNYSQNENQNEGSSRGNSAP